jgi:hypothetical protein
VDSILKNILEAELISVSQTWLRKLQQVIDSGGEYIEMTNFWFILYRAIRLWYREYGYFSNILYLPDVDYDSNADPFPRSPAGGHSSWLWLKTPLPCIHLDLQSTDLGRNDSGSNFRFSPLIQKLLSRNCQKAPICYWEMVGRWWISCAIRLQVASIIPERNRRWFSLSLFVIDGTWFKTGLTAPQNQIALGDWISGNRTSE